MIQNFWFIFKPEIEALFKMADITSIQSQWITKPNISPCCLFVHVNFSSGISSILELVAFGFIDTSLFEKSVSFPARRQMALFRPDDFRSTISVIAIFKLIRDKYTLQVVEKAFTIVQMLFSTSFGNRLIPMTYDQVKGGFTKILNCEQQSHNGQYDSNRYQHVIL